MTIYCEPLFERGFGLGNRLFPWARARIFAAANQAPMLSPRWVSPRVKPLLRNSVEVRIFPRQVLLMGQFKPRDGDITGPRRTLVRRRCEVHPEPSDFAEALGGDVGHGDHLFTFRGDLTGSGRFASIQGHDHLIREELGAISRTGCLDLSKETRSIPIGVHVRLGDFRSGPSDSFRNEAGDFTGAMRTPLLWYVDCLRAIRSAAGAKWNAFVVSDGTSAEMQPLLDEEGVVLVRSRNPISDMWSLSNCRVLLASVGSSFSAWASYLGQMPTAVHPTPGAHSFPIANRHGYFNGPFDPKAPDQDFLRSLEDLR